LVKERIRDSGFGIQDSGLIGAITLILLWKDIGGEAVLLGTVTLEELCLILNPFKRQLQPLRMMLA